ncbi:hypothetical protein TNCT1_40270 [Streptomyces sp. 1-11]|nr:hypothetical protein TNCT1_40270 [Streptomyces sp. 1-11]
MRGSAVGGAAKAAEGKATTSAVAPASVPSQRRVRMRDKGMEDLQLRWGAGEFSIPAGRGAAKGAQASQR